MRVLFPDFPHWPRLLQLYSSCIFLLYCALSGQGFYFIRRTVCSQGGLFDRPWGGVATCVQSARPSSSARVFPTSPSPPFYVGSFPLLWTSRGTVPQPARDTSPSPQ
ncbi:hypothetical protein DFH94DRAFT_12944 [Russula ochroleuca]|uniref:Uncharacterized protein n=1 Tax=Russula ochroleuca TaxID=152965 RepID=A0A9P5N5Z6_9AGAM|nr:hypothetical protein DFH94DRAFT_12944 [Russula ochroleuca]